MRNVWIILAALLSFLPLSNARAQAQALSLLGDDGTQRTVSEPEWAQLPRVGIQAIDRDGKNAQFEGVAVRTLLSLVSAPAGKELRGKNLTLYVLAEAADGYRAVYALAELDPDFTDRTIIVADGRDGQALGEKEGPLRIVIPGEKRQARWVRQLKALSVKSAP
jgi:hypothetical protein